jgi:lysophospholipid acyltransferase (LPLAT)-like uncharacterized protein
MAIQRLKMWQRWLLKPIVALFRLWNATLRFELAEGFLEQVKGLTGPALIVFWHNELFPVTHLQRRYLKGVKVAGLVSPSKDGAWLAELMEMCGVHAVRGSSGFRGSRAVGELLTALQEGYSVAITPDGPRGPVYQVKPGVVWLADQSHAPLLLLKLDMQGYWPLKSWDRFRFPKPFSKVKVSGSVWPSIDELRAHHATLLGEKAIEKALTRELSS